MKTLLEFFDEYLLIAALVVFGSTANALAQLSHARSNNATFDKVDFVIAIVISGFSGTIFGIMASYVWSDNLVIHGIAGVGAFLGLKGLNKLSELLIEMLTGKAKWGDK